MSEEVLGNAIGAFIAIVGAISLFFLQEWWRHHRTRAEIRLNCIKELEYNRDMVKSARKSVNSMIEEISVGRSNIYFTHSSSNILANSINAAYTQGLFYKTFTPEEIANINEALTFFGNSDIRIEDFVAEKIRQWHDEEITQEEVYSTLIWVREHADATITTLAKGIKALTNGKDK